jgi:hypothetical protein
MCGGCDERTVFLIQRNFGASGTCYNQSDNKSDNQSDNQPHNQRPTFFTEFSIVQSAGVQDNQSDKPPVCGGARGPAVQVVAVSDEQ